MIDVLVVGAGPTGLALAAFLATFGVGVQVVERRTRPQESRAYVVQPRTLEVLAPLGLADLLVARGDPSAEGRIHAGGRTVTGTLVAGDEVDSPYPFLLSIPQATVEVVIEDRLRSLGVDVEHGIELVDLDQHLEAVVCSFHGPDGPTTREARYVVGCDGVDSTVRDQTGIGFPTSPYRSALLLADVQVVGDVEPDVLHAFVGAPGILFLFPAPGGGGWRLLTVAPRSRRSVDLAVLQEVTDRFTGGGLRLERPTSLRELQLRRGQAERYRHGRVLLAGDAAHVQSPAGAQGMNTGIQDAANLGWKLAAVAGAAADPRLLDSYEAERWPVARRVRQLTDLAFLGEAGDLPPLRWARRGIVPLALPVVDGRRLPAVAFRLLGGLVTGYRSSPIVAEGDPRPRRGPRAGERLPDAPAVIDGHETTLHAVLRRPGHHLLCCGPPDVPDAATLGDDAGGLPVSLQAHHVQGPPQLLQRLGAEPVSRYLVRPDGYVAYRIAGDGATLAVDHLRRTLGPTSRDASGSANRGPCALVRSATGALGRSVTDRGGRR